MFLRRGSPESDSMSWKLGERGDGKVAHPYKGEVKDNSRVIQSTTLIVSHYEPAWSLKSERRRPGGKREVFNENVTTQLWVVAHLPSSASFHPRQSPGVPISEIDGWIDRFLAFPRSKGVIWEFKWWFWVEDGVSPSLSTPLNRFHSLQMLPPTRFPQAQSKLSSESQSQPQSSQIPASLPALPSLSPLDPLLLSQTCIPKKRIHSDTQLQQWINSQTHSLYLLFVARLAAASVGRPTITYQLVEDREERKEVVTNKQIKESNDPIQKLGILLRELVQWTKDIEPLKTPQRFGNLAFRDWGKRLEEVSG